MTRIVRQKMGSLGLDHYDRAQRRLLSLTRRLVSGEDVLDEISREYARLCYAIEPSRTERAFMVLINDYRKRREK